MDEHNQDPWHAAADRARAAAAGLPPVPDQVLEHLRACAKTHRDAAAQHRRNAEENRERMEAQGRSADRADEQAHEWQAAADLYAARVTFSEPNPDAPGFRRIRPGAPEPPFPGEPA